MRIKGEQGSWGQSGQMETRKTQSRTPTQTDCGGGCCCCLRLFTFQLCFNFAHIFVADFKAQQEALNQFAGTASGRGLFFMPPPRCIFATPFPLDFYCLFSVEAVKAGVCVCGMGKLQRSKLLFKLFKVIRMCKRWRKKIYIIYRCIYKYIYMYISTRTTLACVWV